VSEQPEALRLADALKGQVQVNPRVGENDSDCGYVHELDKLIDEAAAELRRLYAEIERLRDTGVGYSQQTMDAVVREREKLREANAELLEALQLALSAHGRMLMSDPPQDAWKAYGVEGKARAAIAKATEVKP
jgi:hypothetical protein